MDHPKLITLKARLGEIQDYSHALAVLNWDQSTYMPEGGEDARAAAMSTLSRRAHELSTDEGLGALLADLADAAAQAPADDADAALVRVAQRDFDRALRIPAALVAEFTEHTAKAYGAWTRARPASDFAPVLPMLEKTVELSRMLAECYAPYEHIADPLIDEYDYGMKASTVAAVFADLRRELVPLVQAIGERPQIDSSILHRRYPKEAQLAFGLKMGQDFGYDTTRGRQDLTHHPFMTSFGVGDVRITTRIDEHNLTDGLWSTLHEVGHALYEQGISPAFARSPLASGTSAGVHESQSRMWENIVGRSRPVWQHYFPQAQAAFPDALGDVTAEDFYRAMNRVQPSLIRVDADEVTYNLHVMIRFDLELALLEGSLAVRDLPDAWNARYSSDLGVTPSNDAEGCLQDVHWFGGTVGGAFQGYTLGNIMSAMFYEAALRAQPGIPDALARGEFDGLRGWLTEHIYRHGSAYTAPELVERVTGGGLDVKPLMRYLRAKFTDLYAL
jgi:carboxypeptidase Taq